MRVAVCQLNARDDRAANLAAARELLERAAAAGADLAVLPEYVDYLGPGAGAPKPEPVDGEFAAFFADGRARAGHLGARRVVPRGRPGRRADLQHLAGLRPAGELAAVYRKIHLYDVEIPGRVSYQESRSVAPGDETVVADVDGRADRAVDLLRPAVSRAVPAAGRSTARKVLVVPAAFMMHTGRDHWEVLLRARAIENQCYVVAAGQIGDHEPGRTCFGRSMIIDPWGTVLAQAPDAVGIVDGGPRPRPARDDPRGAAEPGQPPALIGCGSPVVTICWTQVADDGHADHGAAGEEHGAAHPGRAAHEQPVHRHDDRDQHEQRR